MEIPTIELCGLVFVWWLYDAVAKRPVASKLSPLSSMLGYSFFIYLFHEPAFNIIKKLGVKLVGTSDVSLTILYLVCPILMLFFAVGVAKVLQQLLPNVYKVLVGGR